MYVLLAWLIAAAVGCGVIVLGGAARAQNPEAGNLSIELIDPKVFRVCGDPRNMPFSTEDGSGYENRIAALFAEKLGKNVAYAWYPGSPGFVRNTLGAYKCDVIMGVPQGFDLVQVTNPYYRTVYALVFKTGSGLDGVDNLGDERLKSKRIGIVARTPPSDNMVANGLMAKAKPYPLVIDTRIDSSAAAMMKDLADGEIDAGILFGPMAGYYAKQASAPTTVVPLTKEKGGPRLDFRTGMGVRFADQDWKRILNRLIEENQTDISRLLLSYGVPLLDDNGQLVTEATLAK